jgi:hypothetical protein
MRRDALPSQGATLVRVDIVPLASPAIADAGSTTSCPDIIGEWFAIVQRIGKIPAVAVAYVEEWE